MTDLAERIGDEFEKAFAACESGQITIKERDDIIARARTEIFRELADPHEEHE